MLGGNRAFMASRLTGRPYMMDWVEEKKGGVDMKKTNEEKKLGKKLN